MENYSVQILLGGNLRFLAGYELMIIVIWCRIFTLIYVKVFSAVGCMLFAIGSIIMHQRQRMKGNGGAVWLYIPYQIIAHSLSRTFVWYMIIKVVHKLFLLLRYPFPFPFLFFSPFVHILLKHLKEIRYAIISVLFWVSESLWRYQLT